MQTESERLSATISVIYDTAVDPGLWPAALRSACDFIGGHQAVVYWHDATSDGVDALYHYNDDPDFTRLYVEQYAPLNPCFPAAFFRDVGSVTAASDLVPAPEMKRTRFFREWMAPQGLTDSLTAILEKEVARGAFFAIQWRDRAIDAEARQRMELLVPHFQRAVTIGRMFAAQKATERALTETLDRFDAGVFLLAASGRIVFANASGRRMIEDGEFVWTSRDMLRAVAPEADRALRDGMRAIGEGELQGSTRGLTVALSETQAGCWSAHVLPLGDGARREVGDAHRAIAAVFIRNSRLADPTPLETLAKNFGLTASEIRVVEAMLRISGLDAIAESLGISRATVKTHLNRVYRKSRVKNQSELIRLVAGIYQNS